MFNKKEKKEKKEKNKKKGVNVTYYKKGYIRKLCSLVLVTFLLTGSLVAFFRKNTIYIPDSEYEHAFLLEYVQNYYFYSKDDTEKRDEVKKKLASMTLVDIETVRYTDDVIDAYVTDTSLKIHKKVYDVVTGETEIFYDVKVIINYEVGVKEIVSFSQKITTIKSNEKYIVMKQPKSFVYKDFYMLDIEKESVKKTQLELKKTDDDMEAKETLTEKERDETRELLLLFLSLWSNDFTQAQTLTKDSIYEIEDNIMFNFDTASFVSEKKDESKMYIKVKIEYVQQNIIFTKKYLFVIEENKIVKITEERSA